MAEEQNSGKEYISQVIEANKQEDKLYAEFNRSEKAIDIAKNSDEVLHGLGLGFFADIGEIAVGLNTTDKEGENMFKNEFIPEYNYIPNIMESVSEGSKDKFNKLLERLNNSNESEQEQNLRDFSQYFVGLITKFSELPSEKREEILTQLQQDEKAGKMGKVFAIYLKRGAEIKSTDGIGIQLARRKAEFAIRDIEKEISPFIDAAKKSEEIETSFFEKLGFKFEAMLNSDGVELTGFTGELIKSMLEMLRELPIIGEMFGKILDKKFMKQYAKEMESVFQKHYPAGWVFMASGEDLSQVQEIKMEHNMDVKNNNGEKDFKKWLEARYFGEGSGINKLISFLTGVTKEGKKVDGYQISISDIQNGLMLMPKDLKFLGYGDQTESKIDYLREKLRENSLPNNEDDKQEISVIIRDFLNETHNTNDIQKDDARLAIREKLKDAPFSELATNMQNPNIEDFSNEFEGYSADEQGKISLIQEEISKIFENDYGIILENTDGDAFEWKTKISEIGFTLEKKEERHVFTTLFTQQKLTGVAEEDVKTVTNMMNTWAGDMDKVMDGENMVLKDGFGVGESFWQNLSEEKKLTNDYADKLVNVSTEYYKRV